MVKTLEEIVAEKFDGQSNWELLGNVFYGAIELRNRLQRLYGRDHQIPSTAALAVRNLSKLFDYLNDAGEVYDGEGE